MEQGQAGRVNGALVHGDARILLPLFLLPLPLREGKIPSHVGGATMNGFSTPMAKLERVSLTPGMRSSALRANSP